MRQDNLTSLVAKAKQYMDSSPEKVYGLRVLLDSYGAPALYNLTGEQMADFATKIDLLQAADTEAKKNRKEDGQ